MLYYNNFFGRKLSRCHTRTMQITQREPTPLFRGTKGPEPGKNRETGGQSAEKVTSSVRSAAGPFLFEYANESIQYLVASTLITRAFLYATSSRRPIPREKG